MAAGDAVKNHPQIEWITEMILEGRMSNYEISKNTEPYVSHCSISNYRKFHVEPALKNARRLEALEKARASQDMLPDMFGGDGTLVDADATDLVREAFGAGVVLAARSKRLKELQTISNDLDQVKAGRAEDLTDEAFGGETGLLVRKVKPKGLEYLLDTGWIRAKLEISQRIAMETGQWEDRAPSVTVQIVVPGHAGAAAGKIINLEPETIALPARR